MAASNRLREDKETNDGSKDDRRTDVERKFITVNFLLIAILFLTSQPAAMFWIAKLYSSKDPNSPKFLIINLMVDNLLYLKFLLDPFVYAWRIPKYRQALMVVLRCGKDKPERSKFSNRVIAEKSKSRETVITLDFKQISNFWKIRSQLKVWREYFPARPYWSFCFNLFTFRIQGWCDYYTDAYTLLTLFHQLWFW